MHQIHFCPNCRAPLVYDGQFCVNCGAKLTFTDQGINTSTLSGPQNPAQQLQQNRQQEWKQAPLEPSTILNQFPPADLPPMMGKQNQYQQHYLNTTPAPVAQKKHSPGIVTGLLVLAFILIGVCVAGFTTSWNLFGVRSSNSQSHISTIQPDITSIPATQTTTSQPNEALVALPTFTNLIKAVAPSVVAINTETVMRNRFVQRTVQGAGSGWIIDENGIIVTNYHVIDGAKSITVQLNDGKTYTPTMVKTDPATDIAILQINAGKLPALKVADTSKLEVGGWVLVVGNPLGMGISAKHGIVSRLGVSVSLSANEVYNNLIETDAPINPGNSGGPLVNLSGEVIGITSLKISTAGVEGMGYAINMADALPVIQKLAK